MKENVKKNANLELRAQEQSCLEDGRCHPGILSFNPDQGYLFQETLPRQAYEPNPRLYNGEHLSLVRRRDGKYQPHLKTVTIDETFDPHVYCATVLNELISAMSYVKQ